MSGPPCTWSGNIAHLGGRIARVAVLTAGLLCFAAGTNPVLALCGSIAGTMTAAGSPYLVTCDVDVPPGYTLVVEPGVEVRFESGTKLVVEGTLTAKGTQAEGIQFMSANPMPARGDWDGIVVHGYADIRHAKISFVGTGVFFFPGSDGWMSDNDLVEAERAIRLTSDVWIPLLRLRANGGGLNGIWISDSYSTSGTLADAGIPYLVLDDISFSGAVLTIEPGVIIKSYNLGGDLMRFAGDLIAEGTAEEPIVFTSLYDDTVGGDTNGDGSAMSPTDGDWYGLELSGTGINNYRLRHLEVRWGIYGIRFGQRFEGFLRDSTFTDIYHCPVMLYQVSWPPELSGLVAERCQGGNGVQIVVNGTHGEQTWSAGAGIPYIFKGANEAGSIAGLDAYLTIEPGAIFKFDSGASLTVRADLTAHGTPGNPIVFTSIKDDSVGGDTNGDGDATSPGPDDWDRLELGHSGGFNETQELHHAVVRYATTGIRIDTEMQIILADVEISETETGLRCDYSRYRIDMRRAGFLQNQTSIELLAGCPVDINGGWVSQTQTGLACEAEVTVDSLDIHQAATAVAVRDGCDAVIANSSFVGNSLGIGVVDNGISLNLGDLSDPDPSSNGGNSFVCNTTDYHDFWSNVVTAENDWWGENPPDPVEIIGAVDIDPYIDNGSNALIPDLGLSAFDDSGERELQLHWSDRAPACGYRVWRSLSPDGEFTDISGHLANASYDDIGAGSTPDDYYYFIEID